MRAEGSDAFRRIADATQRLGRAALHYIQRPDVRPRSAISAIDGANVETVFD